MTRNTRRPEPGRAPAPVRSRRAYFDCRFGQLHVRTAFPTTGGFDEQVTLVCLHGEADSGRHFARFMAQIARDRSAYAPDLPGAGESDPGPRRDVAESAAAVLDLATELRLRQIDLLGLGHGAAAALVLAAERPELVRRLVLLAVPPIEEMPVARQPALVLQRRLGSASAVPWVKRFVPAGRVEELADEPADPLEEGPHGFAERVRAFLDERR